MSEWKNKFSLPSRFEDKTHVGSEYAQISNEYQPYNLGRGFPNFRPALYVTDALLEVAQNPDILIHQYTRGGGHPRLVRAISQLYSPIIGRQLNPETEIQITQGGYHAISCSLMGLVNPGDEVIIIEPFYDGYQNSTKAAGGIPRYISLKLKQNGDGPSTAADFVLDSKELENTFNFKTKVIILNTPHNPLGKLFSYEELQQIANLCKKWNVICIADEVYEWLVYDNKTHIRISTFPDMWERTVTIGSAGKIFGVTGWKVGWVYGPDYLIKNIHIAYTNSVRVGNTILQEAVAICIEKNVACFGQEDSYFISLTKELELKRNFLYQVLCEIGMKPLLSEGGYCMVADWTPVEPYIDLSGEKGKMKDYRFTKWMIKNVGVQGIPNTAFYSEENAHLGENFVRFCFVKSDDYLEKTAQLLRKWRSQLRV